MKRRVVSRTIDGAPIYNRAPINWRAVRERAAMFVEEAAYYLALAAIVVLAGCAFYSILTRPMR